MDTLADRFNNAPSSHVALGTAGVLVGSYLLVKAFTNRNRLMGNMISQVRKLPGAKGLVSAEIEKNLQGVEKGLRIVDDPNIFRELPEQGMSRDEVLKLMEDYKEKEALKQHGGLSGVIYHGGQEHTEMLNRAYSLFSLSNPLHPEVFRSIRKFEAEIVSMTVNMVAPGVPGVCGAVTTGGTESILMAIKAHRDYYNKPNPEMVVPVSAHAAFLKGANYFGIKIVTIPYDDNYQVDLKLMKQAINSNTILLVGSAPSFAHGMIDQISEIAAMAEENGIGCHVDCCLGGFVLPWIKDGSIPPFDFTVKGVTSMSADTHKYGYAVKGTSVVVFRNEELRRAMYFVTTEWPGGLYCSPTMSGSRSGGVIAATWASLVSIGKSGFNTYVKEIMDTQHIIKEGVKKMEDIELVGDSKTMVLAFRSSTINIFNVLHEMVQRHWVLNALQKPDSIHICLTYAHAGKGEQFLDDLKESVEIARKAGKPKEGSEAHIYGIAYGFPDRSLIKEMVAGYLDVCLKP